MDEQNFVDQAHDRAVQRTVDTLNKNSIALTPTTIIVKQRHQSFLIFALLAYTIIYTLVTVVAVVSLVGKINDAYVTPEGCVKRQDARTAIRLGIEKNPGITAEDRIFIDKALPAEIKCP